jgi:integrase/recombinase XerC
MNNNSSNEELLQNFLDYLEFEKRSSKHTVISYKNDISHFLENIKLKKLEEIQDRDVRAWIVRLSEEKQNPRSINRKITSLRSFFVYLQKTIKIEVNPVTKIHALKTKKRLPMFVEKNNMGTLLEEIEFEEGFIGIRNKLILELLYSTGIRRAELLTLQIGSFDFSNKTVKVIGKRNKERIIPVIPECLQSVKEYIEIRKTISKEHTYLIVTESGEKAYENLVYRVVKKYLGQVTTIEKKSPHILRHTFATHLLNNGADLQDIKELLGHANLSATQIYTHNSFEKLKDIYKQSHPRN